jgi:hypothetical protein
MSDRQSTTRFSNRVADYARYRPGYPAALAHALAENLGFSAQSNVADVGSGTGIVSGRLDRLFGGAFESRVFPHAKTFDLEGVKGLARSASYAPPPGHERHEPMMREIERLFARHARDGVVRVDFDTKLYFGRLGSLASVKPGEPRSRR